jgi:enterochelin esterase family protein
MPGTVCIDSFESIVLADNPLGDPTNRRFPVYLPPGYDASARRYPVIYMLMGYTGSGMMVENVPSWGETLSQRLDRLIELEGCAPVIVVAPDCFTRLGGSQYLNSGAIGRYEDYVVDELVDYVDRSYRTIASASGRAVMGKSSGGYGALRLIMGHPEVYGAAACHSGDMAFDYCYFPDFPKVVNALGDPPDVAGYIDTFLSKQKKPTSSFAVMNILAMAACYSPNPESPYGFDLPFDLRTGRLDDAIWQRWLDNDPLRLLETHHEALRRARLLFIDCGTKDNFNLHLGARMFTGRLGELGIEHTYEEFDDDHFGLSYRYDRSIPKLAAALG